MKLNRFASVLITVSLIMGSMASVCDTGALLSYPELCVSADKEASRGVLYHTLGTKVMTDDELADKQWALYNDGSFTMESGHNDYDVYDDPFGNPYGPGMWSYPSLSYFFGDYDDLFGDFFSDFWSDFFYFGQKSSSVRSAAPRGRSRRSQDMSAVEGIDINMADAWDIYASAGDTREVIIALIDTGVDIDHADFGDVFWVNEDEIPDNDIDDDGNGFVDDVYGWNFYSECSDVFKGAHDDHGTHCAGTIAASSDNGIGIAGVASDANIKIMVLKALGGSSGSGSTEAVVRAIRYAEANGASIVNLSLGSPNNDRLLYNAIAASDMLFVVAAGNASSFGSYVSAGQDTDRVPCYPASYDLDNIISVANISFNGMLNGTSDYGRRSVDIAAPGSYILSTTPFGEYGYMTGTSMAAPFVTAAAALVYSYFPDVTPLEVKEILLSTARPLEELDGLVATGGMLDVAAALKYDISSLPEIATPVHPSKGSAPELSYSVRQGRGRQYLTITVHDPDNDLYSLVYDEGVLDADHFLLGENGTPFTLRDGRSGTYMISKPGIFTFYAIDEQGNETLLTVDLNA